MLMLDSHKPYKSEKINIFSKNKQPNHILSILRERETRDLIFMTKIAKPWKFHQEKVWCINMSLWTTLNKVFSNYDVLQHLWQVILQITAEPQLTRLKRCPLYIWLRPLRPTIVNFVYGCRPPCLTTIKLLISEKFNKWL